MKRKIANALRRLYPNRKRITKAELLHATSTVIPDAKRRVSAIAALPFTRPKQLQELMPAKFRRVYDRASRLGEQIPLILIPKLKMLVIEDVRRLVCGLE